MISILSEPERITNGETLKIKLDIKGKVNMATYKNTYFNLTIKKNGGTLGLVTLYPQKFIGCPLEWEVNPYSYGSDGTFNVTCTLQNSLNPICNTTFVVEPDCIVGKALSCNNITSVLRNVELRKGIVKKQVEQPEYLKSFQVQKPNQSSIYDIGYKEEQIEKSSKSNEHNSQLISAVKVQRAYRNV